MSQKDNDLREKFLFTLEWLLAVTKRYSSNVQFGLVHISFSDPRTLGEVYGAQDAAHKLDDILHLLNNAFRKTDLVTRDGVDFWVLVPYTPADEKLADKIREIIAIASTSGLHIVERDISIFSLPFATPELDQNCSAPEYLAYLKKNHGRLASQEISLPPENRGLRSA